MEGGPINGNIIHAYEFTAVTADHKLLKGIPGGIDLKPSDIQLLHTESEAILNSIPDRESIIYQRVDVVWSGDVDLRRSGFGNIKKALLLVSGGIPRISRNTRSIAVVHHDDDPTSGRDPGTRMAGVADEGGQ